MTGPAKSKADLLLTEARADHSAGRWREVREKFSAAQAAKTLTTKDLVALRRDLTYGVRPF